MRNRHQTIPPLCTKDTFHVITRGRGSRQTPIYRSQGQPQIELADESISERHSPAEASHALDSKNPFGASYSSQSSIPSCFSIDKEDDIRAHSINRHRRSRDPRHYPRAFNISMNPLIPNINQAILACPIGVMQAHIFDTSS